MSKSKKKKVTLDEIEEYWQDILWPWEQQEWAWYNVYHRGEPRE